MEPDFKSGQLIFVKKIKVCDINDYGVFCIIEDETTVMVFKKKVLLENGLYCLRSLIPLIRI